MEIKVTIVKGGKAIFGGKFPIIKPEDFRDFSRLVFEQFRRQHPAISLMDDDVIVKFNTVKTAA